MAPLLDIQDLTVTFGGEGGRASAVNGISYSAEEGEIIGVVGESGSGKSVHALALMGLVPRGVGRIDSGSILFRGRDLVTLSRSELRHVRGREIAMVFQDPISSLNPVYSIGFQITEVLKRHLGLSGSACERRVIELLELVGIPGPRERLASYPHELSGGMRQRVMIAMAIACNPSLLIADEPTTALDVTIQAQIVDLVKRLQQELKLTVIWISHDLGVVAGIAQTVNVMYAGRIVERGPVRSIYKNPRHPYTKGLLASLPRLDRQERRLASIPGRPPVLAEITVSCPFAPRCAIADQKCLQEMPPITATETPDHSVRCWHWQRTAEAGAA